VNDAEVRGPVVLVVDDSATVRSTLRHHLSGHGYSVVEAEDGAEALDRIRDTRPDTVLLDVEMPGLDGRDVLEAMRADGALADIPVVFLTAQADATDIAAGLEAGAHDFLRKPFDVIELVARVSAAVRVKQLQDELRRRYDDLNAQSRLDPLTGVFNRGHLEEHLHELCSASRRHRFPVSVLMIDLDHFKLVNDSHGHPTGDEVLRHAAAAMRTCLRGEDAPGRWGGEEFMLVLPYADRSGAMAVAERVRAAIAAVSVPVGHGPAVAVTASVGVCSEVGADADELVRRADAALYEAKAAGRNRVVLAGP
jgi:two-component system cell cycle response regulator